MRTFYSTIIFSVAAVVIAALAFVYSGIYDVSATTADNPVVAWIVHTVSERSVAARLGDNHPPIGYDGPENLASGARLFSQNCVICHGAPGLQQTAIARGLNPRPPNLFREGRKPDPAENFQIIKNGIKMTAMPGFGPSYSDQQIWSLAAFLDKTPGMSAPDFAAATSGP